MTSDLKTSSSTEVVPMVGGTNVIQGGSNDNSHLLSNHKLNGNNFRLWSRSILMFISGHIKEGYLNGEIIQPATDNAHVKAWKAENNLVMSWLVGSMSPEISENFMFYHL